MKVEFMDKVKKISADETAKPGMILVSDKGYLFLVIRCREDGLRVVQLTANCPDVEYTPYMFDTKHMNRNVTIGTIGDAFSMKIAQVYQADDVCLELNNQHVVEYR